MLKILLKVSEIKSAHLILIKPLISQTVLKCLGFFHAYSAICIMHIDE